MLDRLRKVLSYNPETGTFTWLAKPSPRSNRIVVGGEAGSLATNGYVYIGAFGRKFLAHRLAVAFSIGSMPEQFIDHINGDSADNRLSNLRTCDQWQNCGNSRKSAANTSGEKGVSFDRRRNLWRAYIGKKHLGRFTSLDEAHAAYVSASSRKYGEFARTH